MRHLIRVERAPVDSKWDPRARRALSEMSLFFPKWAKYHQIRAFSTEVYWVAVAGSADIRDQVSRALAEEVLADPLCKVSAAGSRWPNEVLKQQERSQWWCLEKSFRPGVTDNPGHVLAEAVSLVCGGASTECRSGSRLWLELPREVSADEVRAYAEEVFFNALIERVEVWAFGQAKEKDAGLFKGALMEERPQASTLKVSGEVGKIDFLALNLDELEKLSRERLWALTRSELECIQTHYRALGRPVTDVEIEVLAQTWSEHCKHKIFAAAISIENERKDIELPERVSSVFKTYIRGATREIPASYLKSVFEDNAGVIQVTSEWDCAIKVETHNSPSALDPYGGALTGIVGVNRDILGVGLGAHPIANLDVFCVGPLDAKEPLPPRLHHPRRILEGVRVGVEHGGNKSGIPTVTGAVVHHEGYLGKPLVFCGTIGVLPADKDFITKTIEPGDHIVMVGGRIGKDGIHGATFSSLEMNEDSPVSAVQLGDPLTQRRVWDFLIEARDQGLFRAVTDNGAGGLSSSIGELARLCGKKGGAKMDVGLAKTKYPGLKPFELVVSESQERMSFAVQPEKLASFLALADRRGVECSVLGEFEDSGRFHILYHEQTVGELEMAFLHEGLPQLELNARVPKVQRSDKKRFGAWLQLGDKALSLSLEKVFPEVLSLPNVRTRRPMVRQYDHEVQARSVRKPYGTPEHLAPNDGATLRLGRSSFEGIALGLGLAPYAAAIDPKVAAELALDEALRNAVVAGLDPAHAALVDNFCWPDPLAGPGNPDAAEKLGALVVTCQRLFDGAVALRMPFVSGKDSMKNDYRMGDVKISVPPTVLITAMGKVHDVRKIPKGYVVAGKELRKILWVSGQDIVPDALGLPKVDFNRTQKFLSAFHRLVQTEAIESAHDVSDGGWLVATAEMLFGSGASARLSLELADVRTGEPNWATLFSEPATSFVLSVRREDLQAVREEFSDFTVIEAGEAFEAAQNQTLSLEVRQPEKLKVSWDLRALERAYHGEETR
ncbi:MAG: AIR synthase-related protein [Bdellovibrionota bacterium]